MEQSRSRLCRAPTALRGFILLEEHGRLTIPETPDFYSVLGVRYDADGSTIRAAYRTLAKQYHPDSAKSFKAQAALQFHLITAAYDALRTADRRAQYDMKRAREQDLERIRKAAFANTNLRSAEERFRRPARTGPGPVDYVSRAPKRPRAHGARATFNRRAALSLASTMVVLVVLAICIASSLADFSVTTWIATNAGSARRQIKYVNGLNEAAHSAQCKGDDGSEFSITNRNGLLSVAYAGAPQAYPKTEARGDLTVLRLVTDSGARIDIGLFKGDKDGVIVKFSDEQRKFAKTIGAKCSSSVL